MDFWIIVTQTKRWICISILGVLLWYWFDDSTGHIMTWNIGSNSFSQPTQIPVTFSSVHIWQYRLFIMLYFDFFICQLDDIECTKQKIYRIVFVVQVVTMQFFAAINSAVFSQTEKSAISITSKTYAQKTNKIYTDKIAWCQECNTIFCIIRTYDKMSKKTPTLSTSNTIVDRTCSLWILTRDEC